jgi:carbonic anhydrase/acetyltransferase-like protein (isoleucine patch superfamily)
VAPNATVIGDVRLGEGASLWHGVILRGDTAMINIGKNSLIQDLVRIASNLSRAGDKVSIGENVYVGPNASLDACTLEDNAFIGMGATVSRGATVESFAVVSAGAHVAEGVTVPSGQIFAGAPAKYLRDLTQEEKHLMSEHKMEMQQLSQVYSEETEKTFREVLNSTDEHIKYLRMDPQDKMIDKLGEIGMPVTHEDFEYIEHRIYHDYVASADFDMEDPNHAPGEMRKNWTPYEQDLSHYPEIFHKYQENYAKYDELKEKTAVENPLEE